MYNNFFKSLPHFPFSGKYVLYLVTEPKFTYCRHFYENSYFSQAYKNAAGQTGLMFLVSLFTA